LFASTTAPFADLQSSSHVAGALNLPPGVGALDIGGSQRAGTSALITAIGSMSDRDSLVIAADSRKAKPGSAQEMDYGAGAVAMTVGAGDVIARLLGWFTRCDQFVDHFRAIDDRYDYAWEERWIRDEGYLKIVPDAVREVFRATGVDPSIINLWHWRRNFPSIQMRS
jgi:3-hydroxy-3-methylglutaryl CoA synthase